VTSKTNSNLFCFEKSKIFIEPPSCLFFDLKRYTMICITQCRPSTSLLVHGGAAADCAKVAYDVLVLAVVWRDERRCRTMSTRGAQWTTDHRPRCPCTMAPPSCAPRLPTMYQCSLLLFGGTRTDVGQCRLVEARDAVSTSDLAVSVRRFRGTIEMHDCTYGCIK
jgi:hypothetical protein